MSTLTSYPLFARFLFQSLFCAFLYQQSSELTFQIGQWISNPARDGNREGITRDRCVKSKTARNHLLRFIPLKM
jgi:hypothetical protein